MCFTVLANFAPSTRGNIFINCLSFSRMRGAVLILSSSRRRGSCLYVILVEVGILSNSSSWKQFRIYQLLYLLFWHNDEYNNTIHPAFSTPQEGNLFVPPRWWQALAVQRVPIVEMSRRYTLSCIVHLFLYNQLTPILLGVGGLFTNLYDFMRNLLKYLIAILGYEISTRRVQGRIRKKLLQDLRK